MYVFDNFKNEERENEIILSYRQASLLKQTTIVRKISPLQQNLEIKGTMIEQQQLTFILGINFNGFAFNSTTN